jgi:hypothetical protein
VELENRDPDSSKDIAFGMGPDVLLAGADKSSVSLLFHCPARYLT